VRTRKSAGIPPEGRGSSAEWQAFGPAIGNVASAAGLLQAKPWPKAQAGRTSALARSAPRPWSGRLCSPTRVRRPTGPSHNVPSRTGVATRCPRGRQRRENPCVGTGVAEATNSGWTITGSDNTATFTISSSANVQSCDVNYVVSTGVCVRVDYYENFEIIGAAARQPRRRFVPKRTLRQMGAGPVWTGAQTPPPLRTGA